MTEVPESALCQPEDRVENYLSDRQKRCEIPSEKEMTPSRISKTLTIKPALLIVAGTLFYCVILTRRPGAVVTKKEIASENSDGEEAATEVSLSTQVNLKGSDGDRLTRLKRVCTKYTADHSRPESQALRLPARSLGAEVVYLYGPESVASVCIPHKVGSHSWGRFAKSVAVGNSELKDRFESLRFEEKASHLEVRAIVVRHPMERLISAYRMIFQDWCDPEKFLAKQWGHLCQEEYLKERAAKMGERSAEDESKGAGSSGLDSLMSAVMEEKLHGRDNFILALWKKFHPGEELTDPAGQLRFTFPEFVRFLVNGSREFGPSVTGDRGISYHWAPYWKECALCDPKARPNHILHMETLEADLAELLRRIGAGAAEAAKFPHTHRQAGGHSSSAALRQELFSTLTKSQVRELHDKFRLDHEMFGYDPTPYLMYARED